MPDAIKWVLVVLLEKACTVLDRIPRYEEGEWYRHGCWGCYPLHLAEHSANLDERWKTGVWQ